MEIFKAKTFSKQFNFQKNQLTNNPIPNRFPFLLAKNLGFLEQPETIRFEMTSHEFLDFLLFPRLLLPEIIAWECENLQFVCVRENVVQAFQRPEL